MRLLITGFAGSGKSTVGALVAESLGIPWLDLDRMITERVGQPVAAIFASSGEEAFRSLERAAALELLARAEPFVLSTGGGTLLDPEVRRRALSEAFVVALHVSPETAVARITASAEERPLLAGGDALEQARELLAVRAGVYGLAHAGVRTEGRVPTAIAQEVVALARGEAIPVSLGPRSHSVWIGRGFLPERAAAIVAGAGLGGRSIALVCDRNVAHRWGGPLARALGRKTRRLVRVVQPPGEAHKTQRSVSRVLSVLLRAGWERTDPVVGLGGGVLTDMAGFVAATVLRGVPFVAMPTTLLAQADASIGGKVGVDHAAGKNLIGSFHQPHLVISDLDTLSTLPRRELLSGLAEVVKCGVVRDERILDVLEAAAAEIAAGALEPLEEPLRRSIAVKARIVSRDEHEAGERRVLNFGHTVGHAIETVQSYRGLLHGEAVAVGMVAALRLGRDRGVTPPELAERVPDLLRRLGLPTELPIGLQARPLASVLARDKKNRGGLLRLVAAAGGGRTEHLVLSVDELLQGLKVR